LEIEKKINTSVLHGYPDIIFDNNTNNYSQKFSSALYKKNNLVYENGYFPYPTESNFKIKNQKNKSVNFENYIHYIFEYNDDLQIVVSCKQQNIHNTYILNFTYIIFFFCIFILSIKLIFKEKKLQKEKSITDNLQKSFIYIIIFALSIVVLSMTFFIYREYRELQKHDLETKMKYIYADISNYFMEKKVNISDIPVGYDSNFIDFATVLSRKYDTDIQIYNTDGELVVTSRPYVFINGLSASLIDPVYFFDKQKNNVIKIENIGSLKYLSIYSAFLDADKKAVAYLEIPMFFSMEQLRSETILYIATIANTFFIILIGAILLNFWLSQRITLSISKISESLKNIVVSGKNLKMEVKQNGRMDEIEKLMLQYNLMVDELEKNTQILLENERNFAWRDMAKQIAHEIKNPLTPMKLAIQQLQRIKEVKPSEFDNYFDNMSSILIEQIDNLSKIASSFSNFAKVQIENFQKIDITQKLFSAVELFKNNTKNIEIIYEKPSEPIFVTTDNEQSIEVFNNLFRNAIQAIPSNRKGKIVVSSVISGENVFISIGDNGCGISDEIGKNIFMPNFSTKNSGTGLGLSIVKHIIEVSNGKIWFKSKINRGTTFFIELKVKN
jgi:signal transduction histidine kinase